MGRRPIIEDAGPLVQWSVRTTTRAVDGLKQLAVGEGVSVGVMLDRIVTGINAKAHKTPHTNEGSKGATRPIPPAPTAEPPKALRANATRQTAGQVAAERQRIRAEIARGVLDTLTPAEADASLPGVATPPTTQELAAAPLGLVATCPHTHIASLQSGLRQCQDCGHTAASFQ